MPTSLDLHGAQIHFDFPCLEELQAPSPHRDRRVSPESPAQGPLSPGARSEGSPVVQLDHVEKRNARNRSPTPPAPKNSPLAFLLEAATHAEPIALPRECWNKHCKRVCRDVKMAVFSKDTRHYVCLKCH